VCTPRVPACLMCPVVEMCATRGEMAGSLKAPRQKKREIHYALYCARGRIFLVQRPRDASLMAGMWELAEISRPENHHAPIFSVRHSITVTDYTVHVWRESAPETAAGVWVTIDKLPQIALTGLTRKILKKAGIMNSNRLHSEARVSSSK
jgi:A/G-specific adenine glycosylase